MLYCGERIGDGNPPHVEIAVDPLDGTTLTAQGGDRFGCKRVKVESRTKRSGDGDCIG